MTQRAHSIDALRGTAILLMDLSGILPHSLPHWMFHAQVPPGQGFDPLLPGITWVDLVFPFFLFCMGASMPFALKRRLLAENPVWETAKHIIERGFLLVFFAIFVQHIRPYNLSSGVWETPTDHTAWFLGLLGFALCFAVFARTPKTWSKGVKIGLKVFGWAGAILFLALARYKDGSGFSFQRMDIIIMLLANMSVFAALIYIATRESFLARLGVMAVFIAMRLVHTQLDVALAIGGQEAVRNIPYIMHLFNGIEPTWIDRVWNATPAPWLYNFSWLKYLLIVLPGTIAGDIVKNRLETPNPGYEKPDRLELINISFLSFLFIPVCLAGLYSRRLNMTVLICTLMIIAGNSMMRRDDSPDGNFLKSLFSWGSALLFLGLVLEPFGGGIKKDNSTLSYYFLTSGLAFFMLVSFSVWIDMFNKKKWFDLLILNGKNPMIAYVGMMNLIWPVLYLTHIFPVLKNAAAPYPWPGFLLALAETLLLAWGVSRFSKNKIYWKT